MNLGRRRIRSSISVPIIMGAIFFLAVTPMALVMRARGKDPLRLKRDEGSPTYWIARARPAPAVRSGLAPAELLARVTRLVPEGAAT